MLLEKLKTFIDEQIDLAAEEGVTLEGSDVADWLRELLNELYPGE